MKVEFVGVSDEGKRNFLKAIKEWEAQHPNHTIDKITIKKITFEEMRDWAQRDGFSFIPTMRNFMDLHMIVFYDEKDYEDIKHELDEYIYKIDYTPDLEGALQIAKTGIPVALYAEPVKEIEIRATSPEGIKCVFYSKKEDLQQHLNFLKYRKYTIDNMNELLKYLPPEKEPEKVTTCPLTGTTPSEYMKKLEEEEKRKEEEERKKAEELKKTIEGRAEELKQTNVDEIYSEYKAKVEAGAKVTGAPITGSPEKKEEKKESIIDKIKSNLWILLIPVLLIILFVIYIMGGGIYGKKK
jgi:hypothetical protein